MDAAVPEDVDEAEQRSGRGRAGADPAEAVALQPGAPGGRGAVGVARVTEGGGVQGGEFAVGEVAAPVEVGRRGLGGRHGRSVNALLTADHS
ncbi:hypothetical protein GCM10009639_02280 [Kitasatospora putterlickiae]|uniref:Uncharacterized protein n=1 Tax=Kitasatospora putterlickiae TaxID=221725 RepID=A0ABN1XIZ5_9ACTN